MSSDTLYPLAFDTDSPGPGAAEYLEDPSVRLLVEFFRSKGLAALKHEDQQEVWYQDWIDYQAEHGLYASVLSPRRYSSRGHCFSLLKLARFWEAFAYFSPAHAYSLHVSLLGLFPILMSSNEALKQEAIERLEAGGLFAFGVSEQAHGSDLLANEFTVRPADAAGWVASGTKYYIGNANAAGMISVLAKQSDASLTGTAKRSPFLFFVLRPHDEPVLRSLRKIHTLGVRSAFVGEFAVQDHGFPSTDVLSQGRQAWDAVHDTVNLGKFLLGFGAVGICEHAFIEAVAHLRARILYGRSVLEMPHIRAAMTFAFARLTAMKLYAYRALDYSQVSRDEDRRYLLFHAVQKARVSSEGVKVMALLSECIGARGFEAETYFESALRDATLIPGLEGSTHINFGQTAQFLDTYFADADGQVTVPGSLVMTQADSEENPYWMRTRDRNAKTVRFADCLTPYEPLRSIPNVGSFIEQVEAFRQLVVRGGSTRLAGDVALRIAMGKCFSTIAYAQLVAESGRVAEIPAPLIAVIFHALIEDLSAESLKLAAMFPPESEERILLRNLVRVPTTSDAELELATSLLAAHGDPPPQTATPPL